MNKTFHKFKLKNGTQVVLARSRFDHILGHQVVNKGENWTSVRMTLSNGEDAIGEIVDRKSLKKVMRTSFKTCLKKLGDL